MELLGPETKPSGRPGRRDWDYRAIGADPYSSRPATHSAFRLDRKLSGLNALDDAVAQSVEHGVALKAENQGRWFISTPRRFSRLMLRATYLGAAVSRLAVQVS